MALTFKVEVGRDGEQYRAVCRRLGLVALESDKGAASRTINALIKETVEEFESKGLPIPPEPPQPVRPHQPLQSIQIDRKVGSGGGSCRGCGSRKKEKAGR